MARPLTRHQPPPLPGWGPISPPATSPPTRPIRRQLLIIATIALVAFWTGVLASPWPWGWAAVVIAWALVMVLGNHRAQGRTLATVTEWVAIAVLVAIVTGAHAPAAPKVRAPVKVEATQADQLAQIREGVINLYRQVATGFSKDQPKEKP